MSGSNINPESEDLSASRVLGSGQPHQDSYTCCCGAGSPKALRTLALAGSLEALVTAWAFRV